MIGPVHALTGYLIAYVVLRGLKRNGFHDGVLAAMLGVIPDVDYVSPFPFGTPFGHHGVTHSPLLLMLVSAPFLAKYRWKAIPYFLALISHILTDFVDNTVPLLAPVSWEEFGLRLSLSPSSLLFAHLLQLFITMVSAYAIVRGWESFPISLPEKYDKLAIPLLILFAPASFLLLWLRHDELLFFLDLLTWPYFIVSSMTILSSSILVLSILMLNSKFLAPRILSRLAQFLRFTGL